MNQDQQQASNEEAVPCANGCGFFGRASTDNMCSRCFKDNMTRLAVEKSASGSGAPVVQAVSEKVEHILSHEDSSKRVKLECLLESPVREKKTGSTVSPCLSPVVVSSSAAANSSPSAADKASVAGMVDKSRCAECKKKVGLTGIECRCGKVYCGTHRMAEKHACTFDFKSFGRQTIEKQNERVVAQSLVDKL